MMMWYFNQFKTDCIAADRNKLPFPSFRPPPPNMIDGLRGMLRMKVHFDDDNFKSSIKKVFQSVGLAPIPTANDTVHGRVLKKHKK